MAVYLKPLGKCKIWAVQSRSNIANFDAMPLAGVEHLSIIVCKLEIQIFWSRVMEAVQVMFTNLLLIFIRLSLQKCV